MRYTSTEAIALRLRGRLEMGESAFGSNLGAKQVQPQLIEQIAAQVEDKLDMGLRMMYVLPVPDGAIAAKRILASIVEKFVVAEILSVHYQQSQNAQMGGDLGYGSLLQKQAKEECAAIGINYPGVVQSPSGVFPRDTAMVLPGVPIAGEIPDTVTRNYSVVVQRPSLNSINWG